MKKEYDDFNLDKILIRVNKISRPDLLTMLGGGVAVMQGLGDYEKKAEELQFIKAVAHGLTDILEGNTVTLAEAKKYLAQRN